MASAVRRESDMDLLWWLVQLGRTDRELYRKIREAMWTMYAERSRCSDKPSNLS